MPVFRRTENGESKVLRNVGILPHHYTVSHLRRPRLESLFFMYNLSAFANSRKCSYRHAYYILNGDKTVRIATGLRAGRSVF
jgi:hypothetical protein